MSTLLLVLLYCYHGNRGQVSSQTNLLCVVFRKAALHLWPCNKDQRHVQVLQITQASHRGYHGYHGVKYLTGEEHMSTEDLESLTRAVWAETGHLHVHLKWRLRTLPGRQHMGTSLSGLVWGYSSDQYSVLM